jgi:hypothetical protein
MTTRTELIARLRYLDSLPGIGQTVSEAADMLEADAQTDDMLMSAARESAARAIAERDKLREAALPGAGCADVSRDYGANAQAAQGRSHRRTEGGTMTTRTELIAELRSYEWDDEKQVTMALNAADMLEADEQGMKDAFASGMSCRPASVQERDKLQAAELKHFKDSKGRVWKPFDVHYETSDGTFSFVVMALSHLHAEEILEDIRRNAWVSGEIIHTEDA